MYWKIKYSHEKVLIKIKVGHKIARKKGNYYIRKYGQKDKC